MRHAHAGVMNASAWIDTNRSACTRRALRTRSCNGTKKSPSRVSMARSPGSEFKRSRRRSATASTTSFSRSPLGPMAPGSSPPWPGSIATMVKRSTSRRARTLGSGSWRRRARRRGARHGARCRRRAFDAADQLAQRIAHRLIGAFVGAILLADDFQQRVALLERVQIEHQTVAVGRHRIERELLWPHRLFEVDHQAHQARLVLPDAHAGDVGVVGSHLAHQLAQRGAQFELVDVDHQARRVVGHEVLGRQRLVRLDGHPRVVGGWPHPHRNDAGAIDELARRHQHDECAALLQQGPPGG